MWTHRVSLLLVASALVACGRSDNGSRGANPDGQTNYLLSVSLVGTGSGRVTSQPAGIDCGSTCSASVVAGSSVTLTPLPSPGAHFTGWSGGCTGAGACTIAMDAAKTVIARFNLSRIVFDSPRKLDGTDAVSPNRTINLWRVNADGSDLAPLTNATAPGAHSLSPQWSRDGSAIVFSSSRNLDGTDAPNAYFTVNIWRVNAEGSDLMPLTTATTVDSAAPQWSPDGSKVVFYSSRKLDGSDAPGSTYNIWRVNADGRSLRPVTTAVTPGVWSFDPQMSPDGSKVVFYSLRKLDGSDAPIANGTYNIWRVNPDGTGLIPLTTATARGTDSLKPQWSPDGSKVVFYSSRKLDGTDAPNTNFISNIWRVNADGTGLNPLTTATAVYTGSEGPQWSPDGLRIVFRSSLGPDGTEASHGPNNIWRVSADGSALTPLTNATAFMAHSDSPSFSP